MAFFHSTRTTTTTTTAQFIWKHKRPQIAQAVFRKKNGARGINLPDFRLYYKATIIKTVWCCHRNICMDQWNKIESPCTYWYLSFDRGGKNIQWGKDSSINGAGKTGQLHVKEKN